MAQKIKSAVSKFIDGIIASRMKQAELYIHIHRRAYDDYK